jgi:hypothetical protein
LRVWWWSLHALLVGAALLVGLPIVGRLLVALAIVAHALARRPAAAAAPALVIVGEDGVCVVPEWGTGRRPLGPRTLVCPFLVRLDLGKGVLQRDILLIADQVGPQEWRRLRALLARMRGD